MFQEQLIARKKTKSKFNFERICARAMPIPCPVTAVSSILQEPWSATTTAGKWRGSDLIAPAQPPRPRHACGTRAFSWIIRHRNFAEFAACVPIVSSSCNRTMKNCFLFFCGLLKWKEIFKGLSVWNLAFRTFLESRRQVWRLWLWSFISEFWTFWIKTYALWSTPDRRQSANFFIIAWVFNLKIN